MVHHLLIWPSSDREPLVTLMLRIMSSRPKEKRITKEGESKNGFEVSRQGTKITLTQKKKDEEIVRQGEANQLVIEMHHNNATTQSLDGKAVESFLY